MSSPDYRPDIDGLRAIAVVSVIAYHISERWLPGGYVGVDIFFVISGFLITGIIRREQAQGTFSFWQFYARRIRRIFPALFLVIACTIVAGYFLMLPGDLGSLADSARWAGIGAANFFFWAHSGYFAPAAERLPLLHTWSLGVEEQFYLVWPFLLLVGAPLLRHAKLPAATSVVIVIIASLAYAAYVAGPSPDELFYSPFTRAWELGVGAALAFAPTLRLGRLRVVADLVAILALLVATSGRLGGGLPNLVVACAGTAILLWPGERPTLVARALSARPIAFVGKISYSLYLWHWPLLVLYVHYFLLGMSPGNWELLAYLAILLVVSIASWRLVELPFRAWRPTPFRPLAAGIAASLILALGASFALDGFPGRMPADAMQYLQLDLSRATGDPPGSNCFVNSSDERRALPYTPDLCLSVSDERPDVLLVGDSHAGQFIGALRTTFPELNFSMASASGCFSLLNDFGSRRCVANADAIYGKYLKQYDFDAVVISSRWRVGERTALVPASVAAVTASGAKAYVLGPNVEYRLAGPQLLAYEKLRNAPLERKLRVISGPRKADEALPSLVEPNGGRYYSVLDIMCPNGECRATTPGDEPMMVDENHLSGPGALWVASQLRQNGLFRELLPSQ
jgi:peptidoglycan/LPS O-acetylase OafA/YrhL